MRSGLTVLSMSALPWNTGPLVGLSYAYATLFVAQ